MDYICPRCDKEEVSSNMAICDECKAEIRFEEYKILNLLKIKNKLEELERIANNHFDYAEMLNEERNALLSCYQEGRGDGIKYALEELKKLF